MSRLGFRIGACLPVNLHSGLWLNLEHASMKAFMGALCLLSCRAAGHVGSVVALALQSLPGHLP
jgi:hypothetical protein